MEIIYAMLNMVKIPDFYYQLPILSKSENHQNQSPTVKYIIVCLRVGSVDL